MTTAMRQRLTAAETADLVRAAADGDRASWDQLVAAFGPLVWTVANSHRLSPTDAADVSQTTWLRLVEHIDRLQEPGRLSAWLTTTAKRESLRLLGRQKRTVLVADIALFDDREAIGSVDAFEGLARAHDVALVREVLTVLPGRQRQLMDRLMAEDSPSYESISAELDMPIGSIGPTRMRCLRKLRDALAERGIDADAALSV
jgi:RNA polymerase sigma factor (sigma-70 family)